MVEINNVNFSYVKQNKVLDMINITVTKGECLLLCGESGCGKTSITRLINGLIPHFTPGDSLSGNVCVDGCAVADTKMYTLAKTVGSVFQNPKSQFFNLDSDSELTFGLENEGFPPEKIKYRVDYTVRELHIENLLHRNIFSMSGGEKQSLAFASVYAMQPKIFVLDEPSANLDREAIEVLRKQIGRVKQNGHTIIIAEHRLYFMADLADRIIYLKNGKIDRIWNSTEFLSLPKAAQVDLGLRSIHATTLKLPKKPSAVENNGLTIKGLTCCYHRKEIISNVNFSATFGDVIGIVGRNGVGKSTFCACICGLLKKQAGTISFDGKKRSPREMRNLCAFVMQDVNHQLFSYSVWDECTLSAPTETSENITTLLKKFNLLEYRDSHPLVLSGGQKQRLAVVTAILSNKKILIFDEPTSGLDYYHMMAVSSFFKALGNSGHIILVVSHDTEFLNETCTSVFYL